jgi:predicted flap endonuclease-1-like 5' DNA nuclease
VGTGSRLLRIATLFCAVGLLVGWLWRRRRPEVAELGAPAAERPVLRPVGAEPEPMAAEPVAAEPLPAEPEPVAPELVTAEPVAAEPAAESAPEPTPEPTPEPLREDDLRRIRGIGPAIERSLHSLGIRTYRQLALLDSDGMNEVREALRDFRQRIDREDWVGQARELHREKYRELPM